MEKARIKLLSGVNSGQEIPVMFNPTEYSITRNVSYAEVGVPGLSMPLLQFVRGEAQTLALELFLDSSDRKTGTPNRVPAAEPPSGEGAERRSDSDPSTPEADGSAATRAGLEPASPQAWEQSLGRSPNCEERLLALRLLAQIDSELHAPPVIEFSWGGAPRFRGVVTSYQERFALFDSQGTITRARVTLQLKSYSSAEEQYQRINPHSPDRTKTHVVKEGERLDMIAAQECGDSAHWRHIARHNGLARPRILEPGTLLFIPPLT